MYGLIQIMSIDYSHNQVYIPVEYITQTWFYLNLQKKTNSTDEERFIFRYSFSTMYIYCIIKIL